jgi:hypothetical protein
VEVIKLYAMQQLTEISKTENEKCFKQQKSHWNKCMQAEGAYFEGN